MTSEPYAKASLADLASEIPNYVDRIRKVARGQDVGARLPYIADDLEHFGSRLKQLSNVDPVERDADLSSSSRKAIT